MKLPAVHTEVAKHCVSLFWGLLGFISFHFIIFFTGVVSIYLNIFGAFRFLTRVTKKRGEGGVCNLFFWSGMFD
jgi:hypothetical protein